MRANPTIEFYIIAKVPQEGNDPAEQVYLILPDETTVHGLPSRLS